ncbi:MAG: metal-dependent hydrolase [Acetivibrionales bacterium]|jgi:L-ascorbate metabolism protein UlaG (beta-lactamase superfamily)
MIKVEFLGHACFLITDENNRKILIDPFLTGNTLAAATAENVEADFIFVTHNHGDHVGDTISIAKRTGATVYSVIELAEAVVQPAGVKVAVGNIGGKQATPFGSMKFVSAVHGSGVPGGLACGYVLEIGGKKIYHAGDTALTRDMDLLAEEDIDLALLPIGGFYTMGPEDAARAVKMIKPKMVVPMHYNTFPPIAQQPEHFKELVEKDSDCKVVILSPGGSLEL